MDEKPLEIVEEHLLSLEILPLLVGLVLEVILLLHFVVGLHHLVLLLIREE